MTMFSRKTNVVDLGEGSTRYTIILESPECIPGSQTSQILFVDLLSKIVDQPSLIGHGVMFPHSFSVEHTGGRWTAKATMVEGRAYDQES